MEQRRSLAPDLARGLMLLFIAMANVCWHLWGTPPGRLGGHREARSAADTVAQVLMTIFVDGRIYPMFAFLFGYGMVQFYRSRRERGISDRRVKAMLLRRHLALVVLGGLHAALLFTGDVLGAYGLVALVAGPLFFRRSREVLRAWAIALSVIWVLVILLAAWLAGMVRNETTIGSVGIDLTLHTAAERHWVDSILPRLDLWALSSTLGSALALIPVLFMAGWLAARRRILEEPQRHRRRLWTIALVTLPLAWGWGLGAALAGTVMPNTSGAAMLLTLGSALGVVAGPGYVALFALLAARFEERRPAWLVAISSAGQRSLSCYLWQSIIMAPLLSAWGLGLGRRLTTWSSLLLAAGVWLVSVVLADLHRRHGDKRGPFEAVLRRITYGGTPGTDPGDVVSPTSSPVLMPWDPQPVPMWPYPYVYPPMPQTAPPVTQWQAPPRPRPAPYPRYFYKPYPWDVAARAVRPSGQDAASLPTPQSQPTPARQRD